MNPLGSSLVESAQLSSLPTALAPVVRTLAAFASVGTGLGCLAVPTLIVLSLVSLFNKNWRSQIRFIPSLLLVYLAGVYSGMLREPDLRNSAAVTNSRPVFQALIQYRLEHGRYPDSLDQLLPRYLTDFPTPGTCEPMLYSYGRTDDGTAIIELMNTSPSPYRIIASAKFPPGFQRLPEDWRFFWKSEVDSYWD